MNKKDTLLLYINDWLITELEIQKVLGDHYIYLCMFIYEKNISIYKLFIQDIHVYIDFGSLHVFLCLLPKLGFVRVSVYLRESDQTTDLRHKNNHL